MSCPHQELFSCEDCIKESIRADIAKNGPVKPIFERFRDAQARIRELEEAIKTHKCKWYPCELCAVMNKPEIN